MTGVFGVGAVGQVSVSAEATATVVGLEAHFSMGPPSGPVVMVWGEVNDGQVPNWLPVDDGQPDMWVPVIETQGPNWVPVVDS